MKKNCFTMVLAFGFASLLPTHSSATQALATDEGIVVTATRTQQNKEESLAAVTLIEHEEIMRHRNLPELLNAVVGMEVIGNGGPGQNASIHMRGTNAGHVLILLDGVKISSATLGQPAIHLLPLSQIERIEVVRGPLSALYGSEAMGGIIHLMTKKAVKEGLSGMLSEGMGSQGSFSHSLDLAGQWSNTAAHVNHSLYTTDGFDTWQPQSLAEDPTRVHDDDRDGYRNHSLSGSLRHRFASGTQINLSALRAQGKNELDATSNFDLTNGSRFAQQVVSATASHPVMSNWNTLLTLGQAVDELDMYQDQVARDSFFTHRSSALWQNNVQLIADQTTTFGVEYSQDRVGGSSVYLEDARDNRGLFLQQQINWAKHNIVLGVRQEDQDPFGNYTTGHLAWGWEFMPNYRLMASWGTAFKAPTFNDLYFPDNGFGGGNPSLQPEESESFEVGLSGPLAKAGSFSIHLYETKLKDLIAWSPSLANPFAWYPMNVGQARIRGIELEGAYQWEEWRLQAGATWLDPENEATGKRLVQKSDRSLSLRVGRLVGKTDFDLEWLLRSSRFVDEANDRRLAGYGLVNMYVEHPLAKQWHLRLEGRNLLDREYATMPTYPGAGRSLMTTISWEFDAPTAKP